MFPGSVILTGMWHFASLDSERNLHGDDAMEESSVSASSQRVRAQPGYSTGPRQATCGRSAGRAGGVTGAGDRPSGYPGV